MKPHDARIAQLQEQQAFASPENKRTYNRELFRTVAPRYATATQVLSFGRDRSWKRSLVERCAEHIKVGGGAAGGRAVLDLACGTGDITFALAERFPRLTVVGLDLNPEMLAIARRRLSLFEKERPQEAGRVQFIEGDMSSLPFEDGAFGVVTAGYALRNAPDLEQALSEIARVLESDGLFAVLEFSRSPVWLLDCISLSLLRLWGSIWGLVLHGNSSIYAYIARSLARYPNRARCAEVFAAHGFDRMERKLRMFGLLELGYLRRRA